MVIITKRNTVVLSVVFLSMLGDDIIETGKVKLNQHEGAMILT